MKPPKLGHAQTTSPPKSEKNARHDTHGHRSSGLIIVVDTSHEVKNQRSNKIKVV
jgi:hypothetical protein